MSAIVHISHDFMTDWSDFRVSKKPGAAWCFFFHQDATVPETMEAPQPVEPVA